MENKDIILFIIVICVIYLLYKVNKKEKESFNDTTSSTSVTSTGVTSTGVTTTATPLPEDITLEDIDRIVSRKIHNLNTERSQVNITESIKNLGILARRMNQSIDGQSKLVLPSDLEVTGNIYNIQSNDINSDNITGNNITGNNITGNNITSNGNICINNTCITEEHLKVLTGDTVFFIGAPFSSRSDFYLFAGDSANNAGFRNKNRMTMEAMQLIIDDFTLNKMISNNGIDFVNEKMNNLKAKEGQMGQNTS